MSTFNYAQYQNVVAQAQANGEGTKVGYFKLKNDGDIAIARINIGTTDEMMFASVHTLNVGGKWLKVSCLNPLGTANGSCGLCAAHAANQNGAVGKAAKKLFIPMLVSYRDPNAATGYTAPIPVIWDRPAAFSRELANKLMIAGDLRNTLVLITRNGKAGDMQTTYSVDILPADHPVFKPEMIPADFSGFNNFNIARHSYWEKTADEINVYLTTGQFPGQVQPGAQPATVSPVGAQPGATAYAYGVTAAQAQPQVAAIPNVNTAAQPSAVPTATPAAAPTPVYHVPNVPGAAPTTAPPVGATPARNFTGFSF